MIRVSRRIAAASPGVTNLLMMIPAQFFATEIPFGNVSHDPAATVLVTIR